MEIFKTFPSLPSKSARSLVNLLAKLSIYQLIPENLGWYLTFVSARQTDCHADPTPLPRQKADNWLYRPYGPYVIEQNNKVLFLVRYVYMPDF